MVFLHLAAQPEISVISVRVYFLLWIGTSSLEILCQDTHVLQGE